MNEIIEKKEKVSPRKSVKVKKEKISKEERSSRASEAAKNRWAKKKEQEKQHEPDKQEDVIKEEPVPVDPPPPVRKQRSKPVPKVFRGASKHAEKRLGEAIKEQAECLNKLAMLKFEIPNLVDIIRALGGNVPVGAVQNYRNPDGSLYQSNVGPVGIDLSRIMSDEPLPVPQSSLTSKVMGGAIGDVNLETEPENEDAFLTDSAVGRGQWH